MTRRIRIVVTEARQRQGEISWPLGDDRPGRGRDQVAWLMGIARNAAIDHERHRRAEPPAQGLSESDDGPESRFVANETASELRARVATLPTEQREESPATPISSPPDTRRYRRCATAVPALATAGLCAPRIRLQRASPKIAIWTVVSGFIATENTKIASY